ncbi:MAG: hypothetical protein J0M04_09590 [Verrucomicrobia bacterium]|nr:hypothetical protein [Verrucomicrobiota bacterium]
MLNQLTHFKKTPVREGSQRNYQRLEASKVIQEVEAVAAGLMAEKIRFPQ